MKVKVEEGERRGVKGALLVGKSKKRRGCCCYCCWKREKKGERVRAKRAHAKHKQKSMWYIVCTRTMVVSDPLDEQRARPFARRQGLQGVEGEHTAPLFVFVSFPE